MKFVLANNILSFEPTLYGVATINVEDISAIIQLNMDSALGLEPIKLEDGTKTATTPYYEVWLKCGKVLTVDTEGRDYLLSMLS